MKRVSTNFTLLLKIFLPIFWSVFFGAFTIALWLEDHVVTGSLPIEQLRIGMTVFFLIGVLLFYFTVAQLKRVEMDEEYVYATNYFKTARYPWRDVEKIEEKDYLVLSTAHVYLKEKGSLGKKITFIPSQYRFQGFLNNHPNVVESLIKK